MRPIGKFGKEFNTVRVTVCNKGVYVGKQRNGITTRWVIISMMTVFLSAALCYLVALAAVAM